MENILVTGAGGFIGSHVCDALVEKGYNVVGLIHGSEEKIKHLKTNENFQIIRGDISDFEQMLEILRNRELTSVIHVAALLTSQEVDIPFKYFEVNTKGTLNLLEVCRILDIKKIVYSSSMSVYGRNIKYLPVDEQHSLNPYDFYSLTKFQGEEFCKLYAGKYGLNIIILRYAGVFGPRREGGAISNFVKKAVRNEAPEVFGNTAWDIIYVNDVAGANIDAFEKGNELKFSIFNIGSGEATNIKDVAKRILKISGSTAIPKFSNTAPSFNFYYNIDKAKKLLNFTPHSLDEGLTEYIEWEARKSVRP